MARILIVANRLPIKFERQSDGRLSVKPSEGGLATGLSSLSEDEDIRWIGWPGFEPRNAKEKEELEQVLEEEKIHPVYLTEKEVHEYYEGFSNRTLWPLFHYFMDRTEYDRAFWETYRKINERFAQTVLRVLEPGDRIWVQDYQLMLVPGFIRDEVPESNIGFFLHIPFPSYEVFRTLIWRKEILEGILGADLIGFHTFEYMRHFVSAVYRIMGVEERLGTLYKGDRTIQVDSFPMGIDHEKFEEASQRPEIQKEADAYRGRFGGYKLILSVDRLDYSKGILQRLSAFDRFLERYPEMEGQVSLVMIVVPSRDNVAQYQELKEGIDEWVGRINGKYGAIDWMPIHYFYRPLPFSSLTALYSIADIGLITPFRDGMNLIAKEFVATKRGKGGALILSEMAGASSELSEALSINPNDVDGIVQALKEALEMPPEEQTRRMGSMRDNVQRYNVHRWAHTFLEALEEACETRIHLWEKEMTERELEPLAEAYREAPERLLLLDYDGTLTPFQNDHEKAEPNEEIYKVLSELNADPRNQVVLVSGRDRAILQQWFEGLPIDIIAEHGALVRKGGADWELVEELKKDWKKEILPILEAFVDRTPGSYIEEKEYAVVWHYRRIDSWIADIRVHELMNEIMYEASRLDLQVLEGDKVIEVKNRGINKGDAAALWVEEYDPSFILCIGDDNTDEDMFRRMPDRAWTLKVGHEDTRARYCLRHPRDVLDLLWRVNDLAEKEKQ